MTLLTYPKQRKGLQTFLIMVHYFGCIICTVLLDETYTVSIFMYSVYVHVHI